MKAVKKKIYLFTHTQTPLLSKSGRGIEFCILYSQVVQQTNIYLTKVLKASLQSGHTWYVCVSIAGVKARRPPLPLLRQYYTVIGARAPHSKREGRPSFGLL